ncbi:MAG TPA: hypothetical protein VFA59_15555 [Vicinamibacterales bacterium]|nr:hypothetical protein [Vicinamibacterales bacterium]
MRRAAFVILAAVVATACDNSSDSTASSTGLSATAVATTESFTGTIPVGGTDFHSFTVVAGGGTLSATLTAAGPPSTIFMGLGIGTPGSGVCAILPNAATSTQAAATPQLSGTIGAGTYCVSVFDIGNQSAPVTYAVTVSHY